MADRLTVSAETLPARDERDAAVKSLESKCRRIVNLAHDVAAAERELDHASFEANAKPGDRDAMNAAISAGIRFGALEADLYNLKDEIEAELKVANRDKRFGIYVSHTAEGLPIRVSTTKKTPLWG